VKSSIRRLEEQPEEDGTADEVLVERVLSMLLDGIALLLGGTLDETELDTGFEEEATIEDDTATDDASREEEIADDDAATDDDTGFEDDATSDDDAGLEDEPAIDDATIDDAGLDDEEALELEQAKLTLLSCQPAVLVENPDHTTAVMALALAPDHDVQGTVTVCVAPVRAVTTKYVLVYVVAVQLVWV